MLRLATELKRAGELPAKLALLAAENPLLDHPSRLERKVCQALGGRLKPRQQPMASSLVGCFCELAGVAYATHMSAQVEAGASAILTQPPLVWPRFEAWMVEAHR